MTSKLAQLARVAVPLSMSLSLLAVGAAPVAAADPDQFPAGYEGYHTYTETVDDLNAVVAAHPSIAKIYDLGVSFEGRPIWAIKISDNVATDESEPEVLMECNMHAREHLTAETCLYAVHLLTEKYGRSSAVGRSVTKMVNRREIWIVPMLNPDGAMYDISGGKFHGWRKNRQVLSYSDYIGIDLNRNWGYKWNCCGGSGGKPSSLRYRGQYPFEAVENQVLRDFVLSRRIGGVQQITEVLNVHSYGEHVLWPYGYTKDDVPPDMTQDDHDALVALAKQMAALNGYGAMQGSAMYIYDGDFIDWAYGDQHIFPFTWEVYPPWGCGCGGFHPPDSVIATETARNRDAFLYLLSMADCPYRASGTEATYC